MSEKKVALVLGSFAGLMHLVWSVLVALNWAQPVLNFIYNLHSLTNPFRVLPFDFMRSLALIVVTFLVGYAVGYIFATLWNKLHR